MKALNTFARCLLSTTAIVAWFPAVAGEIDTGSADTKLRFDNTVKYSAAYRVQDPSAKLTADANLDDGDRNFKKGFISNRVDLLSELDASYKDVGFRVSGAAWYDSIYNGSNDNDSPGTINHTSTGFDKFTDGARDLHGRNVELLDAFVYGKANVGDAAAAGRLGRHTMIYGETLFFGANGIANAQGPVDIVKLLSVPSSQFKEILRPVNQASGQIQLNPNVTVGGYYQFEHRKSVLPAAGSYFSNADFAGDGWESFGPFKKGDNIDAKDSGQGGLQLHYRPSGLDLDLGLYAAQYHEKTPTYYVDLAKMQAIEVYPENIQTYGVSASTTVGDWNIATEASYRRNAPLVSSPQVIPAGVQPDNDDNPLYAVGTTGHLNLSGVYLFGSSPFWDGGSFLGEIGANRRLSVSKNRGAIDPGTTRDAVAMRFIFEPNYFQVLPGLDISLPVGLGYNPYGVSSTTFNWNGYAERGGDYSFGIKGTYENTWKFGLTYTGYFGSSDPALIPTNAVGSQVLSGRQSMADRDFVAFFVQRSF